MKKIIFLLPICVLLFACGEKTATDSSSEKEKKSDTLTEETKSSEPEKLNTGRIDPVPYLAVDDLKSGDSVNLNIYTLFLPDDYPILGVYADNFKTEAESSKAMDRNLNEWKECKILPISNVTNDTLNNGINIHFSKVFSGTNHIRGMIKISVDGEFIYKPFTFTFDAK